MAESPLIAKGFATRYTCVLCPKGRDTLVANPDVYQISCCGKRICSSCKKAIFHASQSFMCPTCEKSHDYEALGNLIKKDQNLSEQLRNSKVKCQNEGCPAEILAKEYSEHLTRCQYRMVHCPYGCKDKVLAINVLEHESKCQLKDKEKVEKKAEEDILAKGQEEFQKKGQQEIVKKLAKILEELQVEENNLLDQKDTLMSNIQLRKDIIQAENLKQSFMRREMAKIDNQMRLFGIEPVAEEQWQ